MSTGSVSRSEHGSRRQSRGSGSGHNTPRIGSPPTNGMLYRSKSSPGTPCSLLRHISSLETIHQNTVGENVDVPVVVVTNGENNTATSRTRRRSSGEDSSSSSSLSRKSQQKVTFEEEAERKRLLENASRTPKPRHQPRRVKTDLGDTRDISKALFNSKGKHKTPSHYSHSSTFILLSPYSTLNKVRGGWRLKNDYNEMVFCAYLLS